MAKHNWRECDWIIYRNEDYRGDMIKCVAVGSHAATKLWCPTIGSFHGTYPEVKEYLEKLNMEEKSKPIRHYVRKEKNK